MLPFPTRAASLPLADWLGQPACLHVRLADGQPWPRHGVIADARCTGSDGGLARYRITLRDWTWWMDQARRSRVFQEQSARAIVDSVLAGHGDIARWRWAEGVDAFLGTRVRSYCVQYRETSFDFVSRLMEQEGIYYFFRHEQDRHVLVLADAYGAHTTVPGYASVPYYPKDEQQRERDHMHNWHLAQEVQPASSA